MQAKALRVFIEKVRNLVFVWHEYGSFRGMENVSLAGQITPTILSKGSGGNWGVNYSLSGRWIYHNL